MPPSLLPIKDAQKTILANVKKCDTEIVRIADAAFRVLAEDLHARRTQPPVDVSAMDGYALRAQDAANNHNDKGLEIIGTSQAGKGFVGEIKEGQAVRIFTGAPLPTGADTVLIQEDAVLKNERLYTSASVIKGKHIRSKGFDFTEGQNLIQAPCSIQPHILTLAAAMNHNEMLVYQKPRVALLATGDELVRPGEEMGHEQIVASNMYGISGLIQKAGGTPLDYGIAKDDMNELSARLEAILDEGPDILVTTGGASVGDHDLVKPVLEALGARIDFWKVAIKPGKPVIFGQIKDTFILGLPGNPVSSLVCTMLFLEPLIGAMMGLDLAYKTEPAILATDIAANGDRKAYLRARLSTDENGTLIAELLDRQDSSILTSLANADCLMVREPLAEPAKAGSPCAIIRLR